MKQFLLIFFLSFILPLSSFSRCAIASTASFERDLHEGNRLFKKADWNFSEKAYLKVLKSPSVDDRIQAYEGLRDLYLKVKNKKKAYRTEVQLEKEKKFKSMLVPEGLDFYWTYRVKQGDTYDKLSRYYGVSLAWLKLVNQNRMLKTGQKIRIPKYRDVLVVNKSKKTLVWKRGNWLVKSYPIAIGRKGTETPEGKYKVINKVKDPVWYHEKEKILPGDPKNLLGTRWFGLNKKGYGIHGTRLPGTIHAAASHGCIRMFNQDVEELFEWLSLGTPVLITS